MSPLNDWAIRAMRRAAEAMRQHMYHEGAELEGELVTGAELADELDQCAQWMALEASNERERVLAAGGVR